jgi:4,5-DOPA dioxygenase extradiol
MPFVFVGDGSPTNALADNQWTRTWQRLGREIGQTNAIPVISAHCA